MKKILLLVLLSAGLLSNLSAQNKFRDLFYLDTILMVDGLSSDLIYQNKVMVSLNGEETFLSYQIDANSWKLILIKNGKIEEPKTIRIKRNQSIQNTYTHICTKINKEYILFGYSDYFYLFKRKGSKIKYQIKIKNSHSYDAYELHESSIYCSYSYNEAGGNKRAKISKFDINSMKFINEIELDYKHIEFSHFSPRHWFCSSLGKLFLTNTSKYSFLIFNRNLEHLQTVNRAVENWIEVDDTLIKKIRDENYGAKKTLNILSKFNQNEISRIEGIWSLNDSNLLVRYFMKNNFGELKNRYWDLYEIKNDSVYLKQPNLEDVRFPLNMQQNVTKNNSDLWTWNYINEIGSDKVVILKPSAPNSYIGKTLLESKLNEEEYFKINEPKVGVWIYKFKNSK